MKTDPIPVQDNYFYNKVIQLNGKVFIDQTGIFRVTSSRGHKYIMIIYDRDFKAILAGALKNKVAADYIAAITKTHMHLKIEE